MQEALLAAAVQWPERGRARRTRAAGSSPSPRAGSTDELRSDEARRRREDAAAAQAPPTSVAPAPGDEPPVDQDDTLTLLFLCCHPALSPPSQLALTLRAVGGLTTAEIARAFLVPEATMAQRISRAKQTHPGGRRGVRAAARRRAAERLARRAPRALPDVQRGLHGDVRARPAARRADREAIRLDREPCTALLPDDGEVAGLLALMLLTDARRAGADPRRRRRWSRSPSRTAAAGTGPRSPRASRWSPTRWRTRPLGPYQLQAAIAAVHDEAAARRGHRLAADPRAVRAARARSRPTRWSRSTGRSRSRWSTARTPASTLLATLDADDRVAEPPPTRRRPRAPARDGR